MDLEQTIEKAKESDSAFKDIYDLTIDRLFPFVLIRVKSREDALDICQEIYLSFWKYLPKFKYMGDAHFFSFIFLVARRQIIKAKIKKRETVPLDDIFEIQAEEEGKEDYRFLIKKLDLLNEKERLCIELRYFSDMSLSDIAQSLNVKEGNIKVIHYRALKKLRELMPNYE